jgi:hypothetical protein
MTSPVPFQTLCEFSENYLGRALLPKERSKLQNLCNQTTLRQNARQAASRHRQEIRRRAHEALTQLLGQMRRELQENSKQFAKPDEDGASGSVENAPADDHPQPATPAE